MNVANLSMGAQNVGDIIAAQMAPFKEGGVSVKGYGREPTRCPICQSSFNEKFECPNHSYVRPKRVRVQVTGVDTPRGFVQVYSDFDGNPLTFVNAPAFMSEVRRRLQLGTFDVRDLRPRERDRLLIANYGPVYVAAQKARTDLKQGSRLWISQSTYKDYEKYIRLYVVPTLGEVTIKEITKEQQITRWMENLVDEDGDPVSDAIMTKSMAALRHLLNYAVSQGDRAPLEFAWPKVKAAGKRALVTLDQQAQAEVVAAAIKINAHDGPILRWTAKKPHRTNENRAFRVRDFDFSAGIYRLNGAFDEEVYKPFPKNAEKTGAEFELDDEDVEIIRAALAGRDVQPDDFVFVNQSRKGGRVGERPYTHRALDNKFRRARIKAGYPEATLEQFGRHSWVKHRLDEGWSYTQVSHYTLNDVAVLQKKYANVTVANRRKVIPLVRTNPGLRIIGGKE